MIITKTPLRISLFGGGTDLPAFYRLHGGAVLSFAINKYIYIAVNEKFDGATRVSYSITENVNDPAELQHDLVRETLNFYNLRGLEITSVSDVPGEGTGLGSSSSFTVGLIAALSARMRHGSPYPATMLAETAWTIEAQLCGHPVGKQDQYAAAYGGLHAFRFNPDGRVCVQPIENGRERLESHLMLFWTGKSRQANEILRALEDRMTSQNSDAVSSGKRAAELALAMSDRFHAGDFAGLGRALHESWMLKKQYSPQVSNAEIDALYARALQAGATGGKLCGAGGGGFLLFCVPLSNQESVRNALGLRQVDFKISKEGSQVIYYGE